MMLLVLAAQAAAVEVPRPVDIVRYEVSGLMSAPYRLTLDLRTGEATAETRDRTRDDSQPIERRYRIALPGLARLRTAAAALVENGADTAECRRPGRVNLPATMDAFVSLSIDLGDRSTSAGPDPSCLSPQAYRFVDDLDRAVKGTPAAP